MVEPGRIEAALGIGTLEELALEMKSGGLNKRQIYDLLLDFALRLRAEGREVEEDAVLDFLDGFTGWCAPSRRIFPDEPDIRS